MSEMNEPFENPDEEVPTKGISSGEDTLKELPPLFDVYALIETFKDVVNPTTLEEWVAIALREALKALDTKGLTDHRVVKMEQDGDQLVIHFHSLSDGRIFRSIVNVPVPMVETKGEYVTYGQEEDIMPGYEEQTWLSDAYKEQSQIDDTTNPGGSIRFI